MSSAAPVVVVHTLAHAVGALRAAVLAGRPIVLLSARDAGIYAGPLWWAALVEAARAAAPDAGAVALLDCGDRPGAALAAIRSRVESVVFTGGGEVGRRLAEIAHQQGVRFVAQRLVGGLDLGGDFFADAAASERRCADFLG